MNYNASRIDASGKPVYLDKNGNEIIGLSDARAAQSYFKAVGGQTLEPNLNEPHPRWGMGGGGGSGGEPESKVARDSDGERTVVDKQGNKVKVGDRINAQVGHGNEDRLADDEAQNEAMGLFRRNADNTDALDAKTNFKGNSGGAAQKEAAAQSSKFQKETADSWAAFDAEEKKKKSKFSQLVGKR